MTKIPLFDWNSSIWSEQVVDARVARPFPNPPPIQSKISVG